MVSGNFQLLNVGYNECFGKQLPRQIKTRPKSYNSIVGNYNDFLAGSRKTVDASSTSNVLLDNDDVVVFLPFETALIESARAIKLVRKMYVNAYKNASDIYSLLLEESKTSSSKLSDVDDTIVIASDQVNDGNDDSIEESDIDKIRAEIREEIERMRVLHSGASAAKLDKYDAEGIAKKKYDGALDDFSYGNPKFVFSKESVDFPVYKKTLSIPKISFESMFKLAPTFDVQELLKSNSPVSKIEERDMPIVVEERPTSQSLAAIDEFVFDSGDNLIEKNVQLNYVSPSTQLREFNNLKSMILKLQKKRDVTKSDMLNAQDSMKRVAEDAQKAKNDALHARDVLDDKMSQLRKYYGELQRDCDENMRIAEIARNDIEMNKNFIRVQGEKYNNDMQIAQEIDSLINSDESAKGRVM